jgi:hypothetical protein
VLMLECRDRARTIARLTSLGLTDAQLLVVQRALEGGVSDLVCSEWRLLRTERLAEGARRGICEYAEADVAVTIERCA